MQPHGDLPDRTKKHKFKKMKQMITEKLQNIKDEEVSDLEQVDLSIELHPIKHYIDDKEEMIEQMFTSLGPTLIQNMLPPLLKTVPMHELKADCLIQLLGMSKKRIFTSIDGKELQSSSESDIDSEDSSGFEKKSVKLQNKRQAQSKVAKRKYIIDADTLNVSIDDEEDLENLSLSDGETKKTARKRKSSEKMKKSKQKHPKLGINGAGEVEGASPISISSNEESEAEIEVKKEAPKKGQTLLEILELEMRAKAIRSLLKQGPSGSPQLESDAANHTNNENLFDPNVKIKNEPREPDPDPDIIEIIEPPPPEPILVDSNDETSEKPESEAEAPKSSPVADNPEPEKPAATTSSLGDAAKLASAPVTDSSEKSDVKGPGTSWSERYLENKETEKLIKTSKMCTNIRKRMRLVRSMQQMQQVKEKVEIPVVIGSISEYKLLIGSDNSNNVAKETTESEAPEAAMSEVQSDVTADVLPASASSKLPVSNPEKANDLVCSDILEIDVSIADLDPDSHSEGVPIIRSVNKNKRCKVNQNDKSNNLIANQSDEDSRPELSRNDEDRSPEKYQNNESNSPKVNQSDEDSRPEINQNDEDRNLKVHQSDQSSNPKTSRNDEDSRPEVSMNDEDRTPEVSQSDESSSPKNNGSDEDSGPKVNQNNEISSPKVNLSDEKSRPEVSQNDESCTSKVEESDKHTSSEVNKNDEDGSKDVNQNSSEVSVATETNKEVVAVTEADEREEGEIDEGDIDKNEACEKPTVVEETPEVTIHIDLTDD